MRILACAFALVVAIDATARPTINPKDIKPGTVDESAFDALSGARANLQQQIDLLEVGGSEFLNDNTPAGAVNSNTPGIVVIGTNAPTRSEFESATNRFTAATNDINARIASATNLLNSVTNMLDKTTNTFDASGFNVLGSTDGEHWMWKYFTAGVDYQTPLTAGVDYQTPLVAGTDYQTPLVAGTDYQTPLVAGTDYLAPNGDGSQLTGVQMPLVAGTDYQTPLVAGTDYLAPNGDGSQLTGVQMPLVAGTDYFAVNGLGAGLVTCNGAGGLAVATAGTDYQAPLVAGTDYQTPLVAGTDYQTPLVAGTDYQTPLVAGTDYFAVNALGAGMVKCNGAGGLEQAQAGTDYQGVLVAGTDYQTPLVAGTDYLAPNGDGSQLTGVQMPLVAGTDYQTPLVAGTDYEAPIAEGRFLTPDGLVPLYALLDAGYFGMTNIGTNCFAWANGIGIDAEIQDGSNALVRTDGVGGRFAIYDQGNPPPDTVFPKQDNLTVALSSGNLSVAQWITDMLFMERIETMARLEAEHYELSDGSMTYVETAADIDAENSTGYHFGTVGPKGARNYSRTGERYVVQFTNEVGRYGWGSMDDFCFPMGNTARVVAIWMRTTDTQGFFFNYGTYAENNAWFSMALTATGTVSATFGGPSVTGSAVINDGQWHLVTLRVSSQFAWLYVDDALDVFGDLGVDLATASDTIYNPHKATIGALKPDAWGRGPENFEVAGLYLWNNRGWADDDTTNLYAISLTNIAYNNPPLDRAVGIWTFNQATGSVVNLATGNVINPCQLYGDYSWQYVHDVDTTVEDVMDVQSATVTLDFAVSNVLAQAHIHCPGFDLASSNVSLQALSSGEWLPLSTVSVSAYGNNNKVFSGYGTFGEDQMFTALKMRVLVTNGAPACEVYGISVIGGAP